MNKRNIGLSADTTNTNICGDDVHDRDPVHQGHVSVSSLTPFAVARESFASQLCLLTALTHGRFASSLCLCLCLCVCLCLCLKPLAAALRLQTTQKKQVSTIQKSIHRQFHNSLTDTPTEQAILLSQSTSHTGAHLMQPSSEAYEIEDRCFRVSAARRLMLPHPAAANPADVVQFCPNKSAAGVICNKPLDPKQHHCYGCRYGGGVDRRHAALARCLAGIIHSHSGVKVFLKQEVPALSRVVNGQTEHARMDLVFNLNGSVTYLDDYIVALFSCTPSLVSAASTKPGLMAKRVEKTKFDRYPHINLVPFILETTGRPGPHARKFIIYLLRDADNPPIAVRDTWSTIQSVLHSDISKQQLTAAVT